MFKHHQKRSSALRPLSSNLEHTRVPRPRPTHESQENIWRSLLDSVSTGKALPQKTILILGGSPETQREFVDSLTTTTTTTTTTTGTLPQSRSRPQQPQAKKPPPPLANEFALGYTYHDVTDPDQGDTLARLSLYTLADPSPASAALLSPLLQPASIPHTLLVILLDWSEPWNWLRQLLAWISAFRLALEGLDADARASMQATMARWQAGRPPLPTESSSATPRPSSTPSAEAPSGPSPGRFDIPLGLPLCVIAQHAESQDTIEKERTWTDEHFEFVQQTLRTVLLRHGGALAYTMTGAPGQLRSLLLHAMLDVPRALGRERMPVTVQHDVVVRDRLLIPPGWDSWGFIRVTREGFDVEAVSAEWGQALDAFQQQQAMAPEGGPGAETTDAPDTNVQPTPSPEPTVLTSYAEVIPDPTASRYQPSGPATPANAIDVPALDTQLFLAQQLEALTKLQAADDAEAARAAKAGPSPGDGRASPGVLSNSIGGGTGGSGGGSGSGSAVISGRGFGSERLGRSAALGAGAEGTETGAGAGAGAAIERQIGPVRGNLGGISVEAEDEGGEAGRAGEVGAEAGSGTGIGSGMGMWRNGAAAAAREPDLREMDLFFKDLLRRKESYGGAGAAGTSGGAGAGAGVEG